MALPKYGVSAVVEGLPAFNKAIDTINNKIAGMSKSAGNAGKEFGPLTKEMAAAEAATGKLRDQISQFIQQSVPFGNQLGGLIDKLVAIPLPVLAAVAAIVVLGKAFIDLGNRGAPLIGLAQAFDNLTHSVGVTSQGLLKDLRAASAGTIADFDLIKGANQALVGQVGEFGRAFGKDLPKLLEIARASARATGQDVGFLYDSIVNGVKKGSKLILDNLGIIINQTAANKKYADSIGVNVNALTEEQKKVALLNATLAAGQIILDANAQSQETNAEKLARQQATLTNIADTFAVAVQPAFGVVLDATQKVLDIFQQLGNAIAPIFGGIVSIVASVFSTLLDIGTAIVQPFVNAFSSIAPYIALVFQTVGKIIGGAGKIIGDIIGGVVTFLKDIAKNFFGLDLDNLGPRLFNGAAAAFGSFANAIIQVANKLIFPAIIGIAKFIADFLIGFSPPKEGPLSKIDEGGANLMTSWLEGISGVSLDPVKQVAADVSQALGSIGKESLNQVNKRLGQLDKALAPFQNRLDIVKAQFDALNEPAQLALDAIDRQTEALQNAVAQGDPAAAERLRLLDQQRDAIQGQVDAQQALVDRAQIQLTLAKAQQSPERTLLAIRQAYLNALAKAQPKTSGAGTGGGTAADKTPKGTGTPVTPEVGGALPTASDTGLPSVLDLLGGQDAVNQAAQGLQDAFMGQIDTSQLQDFAQNTLDLGTQIDKIKGVDIGSKLKDKFKGVIDIFDPTVQGSPANIISNFTGDENTPGSAASFFANLGTNIGNTKDSILASVQNTLNGIFNADVEGSPASIVRASINDLTGDANNPKSLAAAFSRISSSLNATKDSVATGVSDFLTSIFDPQADGTPMNTVLKLVGQITGDDNVTGEVAALFAALPENISNAIPDLLGDLKTNIFDPVTNFLSGTGAGTLNDVFNQGVALIGQFPALVVEALKNFGGMVYNAIVVPIINVLNSGITAIESGIRNIATFFANFIGDIINKFDTTEIAGTNLGGLVPQALRDFQAGLAGAGHSFTIGRISTELPSFLQPLGGAAGGLFSPGLMKVGERGTELMFNASKVGVIPHDLTTALTSLTSILAQPMPMPLAAGNSYSDNHSISANFYGVQGGSDVMRRMAILNARR